MESLEEKDTDVSLSFPQHFHQKITSGLCCQIFHPDSIRPNMAFEPLSKRFFLHFADLLSLPNFTPKYLELYCVQNLISTLKFVVCSQAAVSKYEYITITGSAHGLPHPPPPLGSEKTDHMLTGARPVEARPSVIVL